MSNPLFSSHPPPLGTSSSQSLCFTFHPRNLCLDPARQQINKIRVKWLYLLTWSQLFHNFPFSHQHFDKHMRERLHLVVKISGAASHLAETASWRKAFQLSGANAKTTLACSGDDRTQDTGVDRCADSIHLHQCFWSGVFAGNRCIQVRQEVILGVCRCSSVKSTQTVWLLKLYANTLDSEQKLKCLLTSQRRLWSGCWPAPGTDRSEPETHTNVTTSTHWVQLLHNWLIIYFLDIFMVHVLSTCSYWPAE